MDSNNLPEVGYCGLCKKPAGVDRNIVKKYSIPFTCECGNIKFPYKALNGLVFIWPKPVAEKHGNLFVPELVQHSFKSSKGVVLTAGKGCLNKRTGEFAECEVATGDEILYDGSIPWSMDVDAPDGKAYKVVQTNMFDVNALVL